MVHDGIQAALGNDLNRATGPNRSLPSLVIHGPAGSGKTHLLHVAAAIVTVGRADGFDAVPVLQAVPGVNLLTDLVTKLTEDDHAGPLAGAALDDVDLIKGSPEQELLTLWNKLTRWGSPMLLTATDPPDALFSDNPHLRSRVATCVVVALQPPEDDAGCESWIRWAETDNSGSRPTSGITWPPTNRGISRIWNGSWTAWIRFHWNGRSA